jgi:hypothetical protein
MQLGREDKVLKVLREAGAADIEELLTEVTAQLPTVIQLYTTLKAHG